MNFLVKVLTVLVVLTIAKCSYTQYTKFTEQEMNTYRKDNLPDYDAAQDFDTPRKGSPLVSLNGEHGAFCSGTVISDDYVLTAAHCLMDHESFFPGLRKEEIIIIDSLGATKSIGYAVGLNQRSDVALIQGDFKEFNRAKILLKAGLLVTLSGPYVTCGFPRGEGSSCFQTGNFVLYGDFLAAHGYMFFGMSGGPVVDMPTGTVFAVNSAVGEGIIVAPVIGIFSMLGIKVINNN